MQNYKQSMKSLILKLVTVMICIIIMFSMVNIAAALNVEKPETEENKETIKSDIISEEEIITETTVEETVIEETISEEIISNEEEEIIEESSIESTSSVVDNSITYTDGKGINYTEDDIYYLACCIYVEAGSSKNSDRHKLAVGNVVINRVNDSRFPNSISEVLLARRQYTFWKTGVIQPPSRYYNSDIEKAEFDHCYELARQLLVDCIRVLPENVVFQAEFIQGSGIYEQIGNTYFCYG